MATIIDLGSLTYFTPVFILIFVFVVFYAIFEKTKIFGDEKGLHALIAFIFSIIFILVKPLRELVTIITPWFVILFLLIVILLIGVMILGINQEEITKYIMETSGVTVTVLVIITIIFLLGIKTVFPDSIGLSGDGGAFSEFGKVIFHPKVLGILFVMIVSYFVIRAVGFVHKAD